MSFILNRILIFGQTFLYNYPRFHQHYRFTDNVFIDLEIAFMKALSYNLYIYND